MHPEPATDAPLSEISRITGVFLDPKKAFADIAARPRWWAPLVLLIIMVSAFMFTYSKHVGWETYMRKTMETSTRTQGLTAEQKEQAITRGASIAAVTGTIGAVISMPIVYLLVAAVLLVVVKMMGQAITFKQMFAITCYSFLTGVVSSALAIVVMFLKNPEDFDLQNPLVFNLGAFLDPQSAPKFLHSLATSVDLFSFWTIALLATGIAAAGRKLAWSKALTGVLVPWVIVVVGKAAVTSMFK
jgi:hypothetical protein